VIGNLIIKNKFGHRFQKESVKIL